jgi:hypothetical protein
VYAIAKPAIIIFLLYLFLKQIGKHFALIKYEMHSFKYQGINVMEKNDYSKAVKEFAGSEVFFKIFDETISLVQKASDYLEGVGRFDQARLSTKDAGLFALESVKLTNCLMQVSAWFLGHRALYKGEISEPRHIDLTFSFSEELEPMDKLVSALPTRLVILSTQTKALYDRVVRMDMQLKNLSYVATDISEKNTNHVHNQLSMIQQRLNPEKVTHEV